MKDHVIMIVLLAVMIFAVVVCSYHDAHTVYQATVEGKIVQCKYFLIDECGVVLRNCSDGKQYNCLHDVIVEEHSIP